MKDFISQQWQRNRKLGVYTLIAACGLLIDLILFLGLAHFHVLPVFWASVVGIFFGASFTYAFATRRIFNASQFQWYKWTLFLAYVFAMMFLWSGMIAMLVVFGFWPIFAKCAILPVSFYSNFLFMGWLQDGRIRWR